jgi:hypothetical protein
VKRLAQDVRRSPEEGSMYSPGRLFLGPPTAGAQRLSRFESRLGRLPGEQWTQENKGSPRSEGRSEGKAISTFITGRRCPSLGHDKLYLAFISAAAGVKQSYRPAHSSRLLLKRSPLHAHDWATWRSVVESVTSFGASGALHE